MSKLSLAFLGPPIITVDDHPIYVDTRKAVALLTYLTLTRQRQQRDGLAAFLWPELDQQRARAALRRTLSALNRTAVSAWIEADRESIGLRIDENLQCDVWRLRRLAARGADQLPLADLTAVVALYRDDFMAGFSLRDSVNFDDWLFFEAEELRTLFAGFLDRLIDRLAAQRDFALAILHARRRLQLDPLHEPSHRMLMRLYAWSGQRNAALRQFRACVTTLEDELGVPPLPETTALYERIVDQEEFPLPAPEPLPRAPDARPVPRAEPADYPLVGRDEVWQLLTDTYAGTGAQSTLIVLEGEAGIGKTRLLQDFLAERGQDGAAVLAAACYPGEDGIAYGPILALLRAGLAQADARRRLAQVPEHVLTEAARLLPALAGDNSPYPLPLEAVAASSRFLEGLASVLELLLDGPSTGVLALDNAHWADSATLEFLGYFLRLLHRPLCVILTVRGEELTQADRLARLLTEHHPGVVVTRVDLARLTRTQLEELVQAGPLPDRQKDALLVERLWTASEGLPFFLVEYLDLLLHRPELTGAEDWVLPGGVQELLQSRLQPVGETARQLLTTAAVIGRSFHYDLLQAASGRSEDECLAGLDELLAFHLVREADGLIYDFFHDQLRTLVYSDMSAARRRLLHRRVAESIALAERRLGGTAEEAPAVLAHHYRAAGLLEEAAAAHVRAAQNAAQIYANQTAIEHWEQAIALGYADLAAAHTQLGDLSMVLGEFEQARTHYEAAAARAATGELPLLEHRLGRVHHRLGHWSLADHHYEQALAGDNARLAPAQRAQILADRSLTAHRQDAPEIAHRYAEAARQAAADDTGALARVYGLLSILARSRGNATEALTAARRSKELAAELEQDPALTVAAHNLLALALAQSGEPVHAVEEAQSALAICRRMGDRHHAAALHNNLADFYHELGDEETAMVHLKRAVALFADIGAAATAEDRERQPEIWMLSEWVL